MEKSAKCEAAPRRDSGHSWVSVAWPKDGVILSTDSVGERISWDLAISEKW